MPERTPVREYGPVALEERAGNVLQLERDLVIGNDGSPEATFYRPADPVVDSAGRIYVVDRGNFRVQVFGRDGEFLFSFGREGQGPGEFAFPTALGIVGNRLVVADRRNSRMSVYSASGEHVEDLIAPNRDLTTNFLGLADGTMLVSFYPLIRLGVESPEPSFWSASRRALGGEALLEYLTLPHGTATFAQEETDGGGRRFFGVPMRARGPIAALGSDGRVYATASDQYQVLAMGADGQPLWALRVAQPAALPTEDEIAQVMGTLRERSDDLRRDQVNWPEQHPVIDKLRLDGAGNLYVFPYSFSPPPTAAEEPPAEPEPVPVDVYDPTGERIFAGLIAIPSWSAAFGDYLYRLESDPATEEPLIVRYRIVVPF